jgi:2-polyprenyl-3-methyl-5-hydroxy-6-metoxy-1,4-benzoquinol methylase
LKIINKINWIVTGVAMAMLKFSLRHRISGENTYWLQKIPVKGVSVLNRIDFILDQCSGKKVLHVGFSDYPYTEKKIADGTLLHLHIKKIAESTLGLDIDKNTILRYSRITGDKNVMFADITAAYPAEATGFKPDIVLLSEVLEHLAAPYKAIDILFENFVHGTMVLVTVPNYTALDNIASSIHKTEAVHPHHHWYFSPFTLNKLFNNERFHLQQLHFGMYYQPKKKANIVMRNFAYNGDCIMAVFLINKA